ncbi:50S ribosomal protein L3 [Candidatus Gottesmanbacteria bacterium]|nr:50S ribosomal protein L3 [Candidatus Gottesmanbacteria bacterium]
MDTQTKITSIIGKKIGQTQLFNQKFERIPVTIVEAGPCTVVQVKTKEKDGYNAVQLGFMTSKNPNKPETGHQKKTGIEKVSRFLKEVKVGDVTSFKLGETINVTGVLKVGDKVDVIGTSIGRGFTGVVKRHHFKGGPRTHGQSDRERAPGSIGQTTTPGRVYRGKRMAGRSGGGKVTVKNLEVMSIDEKQNRIVIAGLIPGSTKGIVTISLNN